MGFGSKAAERLGEDILLQGRGVEGRLQPGGIHLTMIMIWVGYLCY